MNERTKLGLTYAKDSFQRVLDIKGCEFGSTAWAIKGMSDCKPGVQWTIEVVQDTEEARLGVNLEGKEYDGWPIATFIENEMMHSMLLKTGAHLRGSSDIWVAFYRDAWQIGNRPRINDRLISLARLSELSEAKWKRVLEEAYACLNPDKNHRGRVKQIVTLSRIGEAEKYVSPHLHIYTIVWDSTPDLESIARSHIKRGFEILRPIHEIVTNQAR